MSASSGAAGAGVRAGAEPPVRFVTLDPGHFHAALVQKSMYAEVSPRAYVYAPLGVDLFDYLKRIAAFNGRADRPTAWELDIHAGEGFLDRMLRDRPGNVVILSGRNSRKIEYIRASVAAGLHVLADKPWILRSADLPQLEAALAEADAKGTVAYDIMTERFEVTNIVQRALIHDADVFGTMASGSVSEPGVYMESVHYLKKTVAGTPNIRPPWFFDTSEQGEGLNDVGTHLVDLVQWTLFPDQPLDARTDVRITAASRWPTRIPEADFREVTNAPAFPRAVMPFVKNGSLEYYCNTLVSYALRGINITLNVVWDWEAAAGGDTHFARYRGTRSDVEIRQTRADGFRPELFVVPAVRESHAEVLSAVRKRIQAIAQQFPGIDVENAGADIRITIPDAHRAGHEAHFAAVAARFLEYIRDRAALPVWERPNMVAKYFLTTKGTELSRENSGTPAPRLAPT